MNDAKHTPGPWRYDKAGRIFPVTGFSIAHIDGYWAAAEANARLIAAAPELAEALVGMAKIMAVEFDAEEEDWGAYLSVEARAALRKAGIVEPGNNDRCTHIMTRNPKEHAEDKCRLCGKAYKKTNHLTDSR